MKNIIEKTLLVSFFFCLGSPIRLNIGMCIALMQGQFKPNALTSLGALGLVSMNSKFFMSIDSHYYYIDYRKVREIDSDDPSKFGTPRLGLSILVQ